MSNKEDTKEELKKEFFEKFVTHSAYLTKGIDLKEYLNEADPVEVWDWIEELIQKVEKEAKEEGNDKISRLIDLLVHEKMLYRLKLTPKDKDFYKTEAQLFKEFNHVYFNPEINKTNT